MSLSIAAENKQPGIYVVRLTGSIDSDTYLDLEANLNPIISQPPRALIIDMEGVKFISSMGLNVLFKTRSIMHKAGGLLMIVNLQPHVKKVFEIVQAMADLSIFASMEEADRYLARIERPDR